MNSARLVYGVGVNNADYAVTSELVVGCIDGKRIRKQVWACPFYKVWSGMLKRCYSGNLHKVRPAYAGCSIHESWHKFMNFKAWMLTQDWEGKHLDKDILFPGNKVYGPDACVFVSCSLNNFVIDSLAARGKWPLGVSECKKRGKFQAECRNPITGKKEYLGVYSCPELAHSAWLNRKQELSVLVASDQKDQRIAKAIVQRYASLSAHKTGEEE